MHRSRLAGFIIDCKTDDVAASADFWSKALGYETTRTTDPEDADYVGLQTAANELHVEVQRVTHESRVHLDIETDDIEAEVKRLEALGARRIEFVKRWCVMEAPTGQRFCVVSPQRSKFHDEANVWD